MDSIVRKELLNTAIQKLQSLEDSDNNESETTTNSTGGATSQPPKDVSSCFSFLLLDSDEKIRSTLYTLVNQDGKKNRALIRTLDEGVSHYKLAHWGDILLKWISGTVPLQLCSHHDKNGMKCEKLCVSPQADFCDAHLCNFPDCSRPRVHEEGGYCSQHDCQAKSCNQARLAGNQVFCHNHCCRKCIELELKSSLATDDPPRNVCEDHPLCLFPSCLKYSSGEDPFCEDHKNVKCMALTKKKKPCKAEGISPHIPYCRDHLHHANASWNDVIDGLGDNDNETPQLTKAAATSHQTTCIATTRKGKPCKGTRVDGSEYCYDHSFQSSNFESSKPTDPSSASTSAVEQVRTNSDSGGILSTIPLSQTFEEDATSALGNIGTTAETGFDVARNRADSPSIVSSTQSQGDAIIDSDLAGGLDLDELSIEDTGGENLQHLVEVFEVGGGGDSDHESLGDDFFDARDDSSGGDLEEESLRGTEASAWDWKMTLDERWEEIQILMREQRVLLDKALVITKSAISSARKDLQKASIRAKARMYENRSVIGGTMVGCISRLDSIRSARPFAVVIEEASEVLEPLLFSCLCESTMKLEMIGDHRQLQPSVMSRFDFEILNKINISMFQRLIEAPPGHEVPSTVLSVQRRMRKSICDLTRQYYADVVEIEDHSTCHMKVVGQKSSIGSQKLLQKCATKAREIPGIGPHIFLWTHSGKQEKARVGLSRENKHEAMMACGLAAYLVDCGVPRSSIAILTPYKGQLMLMRNILFKDKRFLKLRLISRDPQASDVLRLSTVDRFQGDEEDVVICSLVVDEKSKTAFVKLVNRMIVLLSRARLGLYILGNVGYFESNGIPKHWASTLELLQQPAEQDSVGTQGDEDVYKSVQLGNKIPLCCPIHRLASTKIADPTRLRLGFCQTICQEVLPCQHACSLPCHWPQLQHNQKCLIELDSPCQRHTSNITCHAVAENSPKKPPGSDFTVFLAHFECPEPVDLTLPCGHCVKLPCWREAEVVCGSRPWPECKEQSPSPYLYPGCKHTVKVRCNDLKKWTDNPSLAPKCRIKSTHNPPCGHAKEMECWRNEQYQSGSISFRCQVSEKVELPRCGHSRDMPCSEAQKLLSWSGTGCDEVGKVFEGVNYGAKDYDCRENVTFVRLCGHGERLPCEQAFITAAQGLPCHEMVDTFSRACGHHCKLTCAKERGLKNVPIPPPVTEYVEGQITPRDPTHTLVKCKERVKLRRKCGHVEDIMCWRADKPLQKCSTKEPAQSALCGHVVSLPCSLKGILVWPGEIYSDICSSGQIQKDAARRADCARITPEVASVFNTCTKSVIWNRECGHTAVIKCADLLKVVQNSQRLKSCEEKVVVSLSCGHQVPTTCFKKSAWDEGEISITCTAQGEKPCWNHAFCGRTLHVPCGYSGLAGCSTSSAWTCAERNHQYDIHQCRDGRPLSCPGCSLESIKEASCRRMTAPDDLPDSLRSLDSLQNYVDLMNPQRLSQFNNRWSRMLGKHIQYLESTPPWARQVTKSQLVSCFRVLKRGSRKSEDWFNPKSFAHQRTLSGILVKELTQPNLLVLASTISETETLTLLVGCGAVARTKLFEGSNIPQKGKKVIPLLNSMAQEGFDSLAYTDERGFKNVILQDPFPLLAVYRVTLSQAELIDFAKRLDVEGEWDFNTLEVQYDKSNENILLCDQVRKFDEEEYSSMDDGSEDGSLDMPQSLAGTLLEGFQVQSDQLLDGIGFEGKIPSNVEISLAGKLQFTNRDVPPFAGIKMIKTIAEDVDLPLMDLLFSAEYYEHDQIRSREHLMEYLQKVRESEEKLHPWTLVMSARFETDKDNSKRLLSLFLDRFPTQEKCLSEQDKAKLEDSDEASLDTRVVDIVHEQWVEIKESFQLQSEATEKLLSLTGLKKVKEEVIRIWKSAMQLQRMDDEVRKQNTMSFNYCFLGNPGTGKTTVARLFSEILCDSKIRRRFVIEEITAQEAKDGGTDEFRKKVEKARNGVLFIDEAYDLDPVGDFKGKPIVNELLTLCENDRETISVILAGYEDEFQKKFFAYNPGLKSRFKEVTFEDFDDVELSKIWTDMRSSKKWEEAAGVTVVVVNRMLKMSGRKGFGNAREVRRRLEGATQSAMVRLGNNFSQETMRIEVVDVIGEDPRLSSEKLMRVRAEIDSKIGWARIKQTIDELIEICGINYQRELQGQAQLPIFLNRLFLGNPGTGKTTCAKIYGKLLRELGFLSNGGVVSKTASDFIGSVVGESQNRTVQILEGSQGKVLIIDEAYVLDDSLFGKQVLDTLVEKVQGGPSDDLAVLLLGYEEQMVQMLRQQNPGLARRFPKEYAFYFDDYTESELLKILKAKLESEEIEASVEFLEKSMAVLRVQQNQSNFGNAGAVDLLVKGALQKASARIAGSQATVCLEASDVEDPGSSRAAKDGNPLDILDELFRMEKVKEQLESMKRSWEVSNREGDDTPDLGHFVFLGSPGTGKTTVVRALADVLFGLGLLPSNTIKETSALDLTGDYLGQTKTKVNEALKDAKGGVLFIDEAYNLGCGPYGKEACDTIVAGMTSKEFCDVVVVIAGYPNEIDEMLNSNAGLKSRFTHYFNFPDWDPSDCIKFLKLQAEKEKFLLEPSGLEMFKQGCSKLKMLDGWGNGRDVKKLWAEAKKQRASRVYDNTKDVSRSIQCGDFEKAISTMLAARKPKAVNPSPHSSAYPSSFATQDSSDQRTPPSFKSSIAEDALTGREETAEGTDGNDIGGPEEQDHLITEYRDDGVTDDEWTELQLAKERDRMRMEEIAREEEALKAFIAAQLKAEEEAQRKLEIEMERMRLELEREEQEKAIRAAQEAETKRKHEAAMERKRREEEQRRKQEELRKQQRIREKLQQLRPCPMGYNWSKVGGGWRCGGGSHFVSDKELQRNFTF